MSCYYDYDNCVILQGHVDEDRNLVIDNYFEANEIPVEEVVKQIDAFPLIKPWVNMWLPLTEALCNVCEIFDFNLQNQTEVSSLLGFFKQLRDEKRIKYTGDFRKDEEIKALQLLLKAAIKDLVREPLVFSETLGDGEPKYPHQNPYGLYGDRSRNNRRRNFY